MNEVTGETKRWSIPERVVPTRNSAPGSFTTSSRTTEPENLRRMLARQEMLNDQLLETQRNIHRQIMMLRQEVHEASRLNAVPFISEIGRKAISVAREQPIGYVVAVGVLSLAVVALVADKITDN